MYKVEFVQADMREGSVEVDGAKLAADLEATLNQLEEQQFEIFQVTPVQSGSYDFGDNHGFGFSYTEGVLVAAKKAE